MELYKRIRRIVTKSAIASATKNSSTIFEILNHHFSNGRLKTTESIYNKNFLHIANFTTGNAGDTLLTIVLRDLLTKELGFISWENQHVHDIVTPKILKRINRNDAVIIGGGGLFLRDTNPNSISGWQWSIYEESYKKIKQPLVLFAVGYNRFRGQPEFGEMFKGNLKELFEKAVFVGLRNHGSIRNIKNYVAPSFHKKIYFQPCMTTLLTKIYPEIENVPIAKKKIIGINCAFDRAKNRFGDKYNQILNSVANATKKLSKDYEINYLSHAPGDEIFLETLDANGVKYNLVKLYHKPSEEIIKEYRRVSLVLGMRGHAQMIPFGCLTPIISLISHQKLKWFLDDIEFPEWGIDVLEDDLEDKIYKKSSEFILKTDELREQIKLKQDMLWDITMKNIEIIRAKIS